MGGGGARVGYAMALGAAALWAVTGSVSRVVIDAGIDGTSLAQIRMTGAALLLVAFLAWRAPHQLRVRRAELAGVVAFGVLGLAMVQWLYFEALARIPLGLSLVIEYTAPLLVALWLTAIGRERLPAGVWAALVVALAGLAVAVGAGEDLGGLNTVGLAAAGGAAVAYAVYLLLAERELERRSTTALLALGMTFGALFWALVHPWWGFPFDVLGASVPLDGEDAVRVPVAALVGFIVVLGTIVPFSLIVGALPRIGATATASTAMVEPVLAAAVAWPWLGQRLTLAQVAGGLATLAAVVAAQALRGRARRTHAALPVAARGTPRP
jgi:drug/metabolite transporter (DMT)-like permease